ncbi:MAG: class I SAM-dependent methyltransferase [Burkholderiaceae bacterium]|nr:class I SAM-dependent methyltransferase [Burkholderiaceae bacterium]
MSPATLHWTEQGEEKSALWQSEAGAAPPKRIVVADDRMTADAAYRLASEGNAMLWRGDFQNARQLLQALARRCEVRQRKQPATAAEAFHFQRQAQSHRARILGTILLPCDEHYAIPLRRAPDIRQACLEAYGEPHGAFVVSLREVQGLIGAHEWRKKGVEIPALAARIHPHYGVFSPVRGEYLELVAKAPLPSTESAIDVGTGTGVLAAILAKRGIRRVIATDMEARALQCARANIETLGYADQVQVVQADLFPANRAKLIVCNPPWVPARAYSPLEHAVYDPDSRMLRGFLAGLAGHLEDGGEGWLILSDLAEHLGLRTRAELMSWIADGGLQVTDKIDTKPLHPKAMDRNDPLYAARSAELTSLWRIVAS